MGEDTPPLAPWDLQIYGAIVTHANHHQWGKLIAMHGSELIVAALEDMAMRGDKGWLADVASLLLQHKRRRHSSDEDVIYE